MLSYNVGMKWWKEKQVNKSSPTCAMGNCKSGMHKELVACD